MDNREIARLLSETADLMEIAGEDGFRIRSYRNAAAVLEGYPEQVSAIIKDPSKKVTDIPGIGKGIASALEEIEQRGSFERRDQMLELYPPTALELLKIQGLGPKSIRTLFEHYRVSTIDGLERICREHKLRELPRMGEKLEEKVLRSIAQYRQRAGRFLLSFAYGVAEELSAYLLELKGVERVTPAGSLRRGKETVGDLDLLATGPGAEAAIEKFAAHPKVHEVLGKGPNKASVKFGLEGLQVDLRALPDESYGAALQYFTGSKEHNINLRSRAQKMGLTLSEYSLARVGSKEVVASATEEDIYKALGLHWIPPELRENQGEIEAAERNELPHLVDLKHIRGDLHMHTTESDGRATLDEMAEAARELGYEYIAITDHSRRVTVAHGLDARRLSQQIAETDRLNEKLDGITVLKGVEVDILADGKLDLPDTILSRLDIVVASVHSHFDFTAAAQTERIIRAMDNRHLSILGHPTGRLIGEREPYALDLDRVIAAARERGCFLEINSQPERLDLNDIHVQMAKDNGVKLAISTDAHSTNSLSYMRFGIDQARRGRLTRSDVINTRPLAELRKLLKR